MPGKWKSRNPLSLEERIRVQEALDLNMSYREMSIYVGRCKSVVMRESRRLGSIKNYNPHKAQKDFEEKQKLVGKKRIMGRKKTIEEEINIFLELWDYKQQIQFLKDIIPLFELYDIEDEYDWVEKSVGGTEQNVATIRLIRTVYLVSKIAEFHASKMCAINTNFKNLWKRMEKQGRGQRDGLENYGAETVGDGANQSHSSGSVPEDNKIP